MEIDEILGKFHTLPILQKAKNTTPFFKICEKSYSTGDIFISVTIAQKFLKKSTHSLIKQEIDWIVHKISKKNKGILIDFLRLHCENWQKVTLAYATKKLSIIEKNTIKEDNV